MRSQATAEYIRLTESERRSQHWRRWGPFLPERQWGTVREDYSPDGSCWTYFPYEHSRSRVYRWGEDGLLGWCDRKCRLCFGLALWNYKDSHLKEKLFGLTGPQGNHGEDVKEVYYYLKALPSFAYAQAAYCYPKEAFPYERLVQGNGARTLLDGELELWDLPGVFDNGYFDVVITYAKGTPNDTLIQIDVRNVSDTKAELAVIPMLWFRNTWDWGRVGEAFAPLPKMYAQSDSMVCATQDTLGSYRFCIDGSPHPWEQLWTNNQTNFELLFGQKNPTPFSKDAFHRYLVDGDSEAVSKERSGTKMGFSVALQFAPFETQTLRMRLVHESEFPSDPFSESFERTLNRRAQECEEFYRQAIHPSVPQEHRQISEQAYAGLLWTQQFYYFSVREWQEGDPTQPPPAKGRSDIRNREWSHLYNMDVISMPDKWEYPWYAAWDSAFHMVTMGDLDTHFAKEQLILFLREWYMHPNGQIPAYEWKLSDVNPPVHAWACWQVYKMTGPPKQRDKVFLARVFQKLLLNFTWWVNRKDPRGRHVF
ncbi:MAG: hypothetical protein KDD60_09500, partial [Bdellovibrionales bacterium]|nr:hypothetical protein [Bdellovibrionales bacterium]